MKSKIKTYIPKPKLKIQKEETLPAAIDIGSYFSTLGGMFSFFASSFLLSVKTFFRTKKRVNEIRAKYEKTIDLRDQGK